MLNILLRPVGRVPTLGLLGLALGVGLALTGASYLAVLAFVTVAGWSMPSFTALEFWAVLTSYACTYLCNVQSRWNYPLGAISTALYCWLFLIAKPDPLIGSAALNAYLVPVLLYGWWRWGRDTSTRPVQHVQLKMVPVYLATTVVVYYACLVIVTYFGGGLGPWDTAILVLSVLAQLLLDNKKIETWIVWVLVNVIAIGVYASQGYTLVTGQYVFFLANTILGWVLWHRSMGSPGRGSGGDLPWVDLRSGDSDRTKALPADHFTIGSATRFVAANPGLSGFELEALDAEQEDRWLADGGRP